MLLSSVPLRIRTLHHNIFPRAGRKRVVYPELILPSTQEPRLLFPNFFERSFSSLACHSPLVRKSADNDYREALHFNFNIHSRGKIQVGELINRLRRRIQNINHSFVNAHLVLITCIFMHKRGAIHRHPMHLGRQRYWSGHTRPRPFRRFHNLARGLINYLVIVRFDLDTNSIGCISWFRLLHANGNGNYNAPSSNK